MYLDRGKGSFWDFKRLKTGVRLITMSLTGSGPLADMPARSSRRGKRKVVQEVVVQEVKVPKLDEVCNFFHFLLIARRISLRVRKGSSSRPT